MLFRQFAKAVSRNDGGVAGDLDNDGIQRYLMIEGRAGAELTIFANHPCLDRSAADQFDDAGNDARMREYSPILSLPNL